MEVADLDENDNSLEEEKEENKKLEVNKSFEGENKLENVILNKNQNFDRYNEIFQLLKHGITP